jgi:hypothetical protein
MTAKISAVGPAHVCWSVHFLSDMILDALEVSLFETENFRIVRIFRGKFTFLSTTAM